MRRGLAASVPHSHTAFAEPTSTWLTVLGVEASLLVSSHRLGPQLIASNLRLPLSFCSSMSGVIVTALRWDAAPDPQVLAPAPTCRTAAILHAKAPYDSSACVSRFTHSCWRFGCYVAEFHAATCVAPGMATPPDGQRA